MMDFTFELTGYGWADGYIEIDNESHEFAASYLTDALGDLLSSLVQLCPECSHVPRNEMSFAMNEEPDGTLWELRRLNDKELAIRIVWYPDIDSRTHNGMKVVLDKKCSRFNFVVAVIGCVDNLLRKHGVEGYNKLWGRYEFPMTHYQRLKQWVENANS